MFLYNFLSLTKSFNSHAIRFKLSQGYCPCKSIGYLPAKKRNTRGFPLVLLFVAECQNGGSSWVS